MSDGGDVSDTAVVALAGRRVDAEGTNPPRFPLANVPMVSHQLNELLHAERAVALVCSAACGADLVALEEAERLGLRRRIVLPFSAQRFLETSVIDRPGEWGPVFNRLVAASEAAGDLVVLEGKNGGDADYADANEAIIREAKSIADAGEYRLMAVLVWEGVARSEGDTTAAFQRLAADAGFAERTIRTI